MKYFLAALALVTSNLAFADGAAPQAMEGWQTFIFFGGFLVIFYFLLWRPQSKRQKEHRNLVDSLEKGNEVQTAGGILGKIIKVTDDFVVVEVDDKVTLPIHKTAVVAMLPNGTLKALKS